MSSVVSIHALGGRLVGTGIVVAQDLVLTCAHVVNEAIGRHREEQTRPTDDREIEIRFAGAPKARDRATIDAGLDAWSGPPAGREEGADLCLLKLRGRLPEAVSVGQLNPVRFKTEFGVRASGYPADWNNGVSAPQIDVALAKVLGVDGYLWLIRADQPSLMAALATGKRSAGLIYSGFSGGPVQVHDTVVGLVTAARAPVEHATSYAIPAHFFPKRILPSEQTTIAATPLAPIKAARQRSAAIGSRAIGENPKPLFISKLALRDTYLMIGNSREELELSGRYIPTPLTLLQDIRSVYTDLAKRAEERAKAAGAPYFPGPNTRLIRLTQGKTRQLATGKEQKGIVLELGPVSWEEYSVLNTFLDEEVFEGRLRTIRARHANPHALFEEATDLSFCPLSNLLTVMMIPVTTDGFGLIQRRSRSGVSVNPGRLTAGVTENIHRYLDEASGQDLRRRLHAPFGGSVDYHYAPLGVPSPVLAAERGVLEEVSTEIHRLLQNNYDRYKFVNVVFDLREFHPYILGIVELPFARMETERLIQTFPGVDHTEYATMEYLKLDQKNPDIAAMALGEWAPGALAAFASAIGFCDRQGLI